MNLKNIFETALKAGREDSGVLVKSGDRWKIRGFEDVDLGSSAILMSGRVPEKSAVQKETEELILLCLPERFGIVSRKKEGSDAEFQCKVFTRIVADFCELLGASGKPGAIECFGGGIGGALICEAGRCFIDDILKKAPFAIEPDILSSWGALKKEHFFRPSSFLGGGSSPSAGAGSHSPSVVAMKVVGDSEADRAV